MGMSATLALFNVATLAELRALGDAAETALNAAFPDGDIVGDERLYAHSELRRRTPGDAVVSLCLDKSWDGRARRGCAVLSWIA